MMKGTEWTIKFIPHSPITGTSRPKVIFLPDQALESMNAKEMRDWLLRLHSFFQEILNFSNTEALSTQATLAKIEAMTRAIQEINEWINKKYGQDRPNSL